MGKTAKIFESAIVAYGAIGSGSQPDQEFKQINFPLWTWVAFTIQQLKKKLYALHMQW